MADVLPMPALKLSNPVIFRVGMVADNPSFHANVIAERMSPRWSPLGDGTAARSKVAPTGDSRTTLRLPGRLGFAWWLLVLDMTTPGCIEHWIAQGAAVPVTPLRTR